MEVTETTNPRTSDLRANLVSIRGKTRDLERYLKDTYQLENFAHACLKAKHIASSLESLEDTLKEVLEFSCATTLELLNDVLATWDVAMEDLLRDEELVRTWLERRPPIGDKDDKGRAELEVDGWKIKTLYDRIRSCDDCLQGFVKVVDG
jgi:hypothetical protein